MPGISSTAEVKREKGRPLVFAINSQRHELAEVDPAMTLVEYIRTKTPYTGTKLACGEGGCGACAVIVARCDPKTGVVTERSVNACLAPLCSVDGCAVTTSEGLGTSAPSRSPSSSAANGGGGAGSGGSGGGNGGLHAVHRRLAGFHASQCGFCTPGMSVALYAGLRDAKRRHPPAAAPTAPGASNGDGATGPAAAAAGAGVPGLTVAEAEAAVAGNLCRCTGYRPILDACKSFAGGLDVEDLALLGLNTFCKEGGGGAGGATCRPPEAALLPPYDPSGDPKFPEFLKEELDTREYARTELAGQVAGMQLTMDWMETGQNGGRRLWLTPGSLEELFVALAQHRERHVRLVVGNTSAGIYKDERPDVYVSLREVPELTAVERQPAGVTAGAALTLAELGEVLLAEAAAHGDGDDAVFPALARHLARVATSHVRNAGSLGGNLVMAARRAFESDVATILLGAGASVTLISPGKGRTTLMLEELLAGTDSEWEQGAVLLDVWIPSWRAQAAQQPPSGGGGGGDGDGENNTSIGNGGGAVGSTSLRGFLQARQADEGGDEGADVAADVAGGDGAEPALEMDKGPLRPVVTAAASAGGKLVFRTFRAAARPLGNAHAYVNAAFLAVLEREQEQEEEQEQEQEGGGRGGGGGGGGGGALIKYTRLAFGAFGGKHAVGARQVEAFLAGKRVTAGVLLEAIGLLPEDVAPPPGASKVEYRASTAGAFLFKFFSPFMAGPSPPRTLEPPAGGNAPPPSSNGTASGGANGAVGATAGGRGGAALTSGRQKFEFSQEHYPVAEPIAKIGAELQASGEAVYIDDIPVPATCLYAAFVKGAHASALVTSVDAQPALACSGVAAYVDASAIPPGGKNVGIEVFGAFEALFATDKVEFVGHPLGLVVADSYKHASEAAELVRVEYNVAAADPPMLTVDDAVAREAYFPQPPFFKKPKWGDFEKAFGEAEMRIEGAQVSCGTQQHFYMEPQVALAVPDEGGTLTVYSATQTPEGVQKAVAAALGLHHNRVRVVTRRLGGSFGGKALRASQVAVACALAAHTLQRPVKMALDRNTDMALVGGRHATRATYDVGFGADGRICALRVRALMNAGWSSDVSFVAAYGFKEALVHYDWGALDVDVKLCRTNLSSKTTMRAPGEIQGAFFAETVVEHVAALTGLDPQVVRELNRLTPGAVEANHPGSFDIPPVNAPPPSNGASGAAANGAAANGGAADGGAANGGPANNSASDGGAASGSPSVNGDGDGGGDVDGFTLPRVWDGLKASGELARRRAEVDAANARDRWRKRGIAMAPCAYRVMVMGKPSRVSVFADGSVVVEEGGVEMGQGLWTKVRQTVAFSLSSLWDQEDQEQEENGAADASPNPTASPDANSGAAAEGGSKPSSEPQAAGKESGGTGGGGGGGGGKVAEELPEAARTMGAKAEPARRQVASRGVSMDLVRVVDQDTLSLPNGGMTAGSSTSEASCGSVRMACEVLVGRLRPLLKKMEEAAAAAPGGGERKAVTWEALVQRAKMTGVDLSAQAVYTGKTPDGKSTNYYNFGAAISEVEVDVLTGEVTVVRSDIAYDCGKSLNPAVDIGQVEGAFVQGVGFFTTEEVVVDAGGKLLSDGTWDYKIPSYDTIPRQLSVELLHGAPHRKGVLSSKASGEPPLLLATSVHSAIRHAIRAARADLQPASSLSPSAAGPGEPFLRLDAPLTFDRVKAACGLDSLELYLADVAASEKSKS